MCMLFTNCPSPPHLLQGRSYLFIPKQDPSYAIWCGPVHGPDYYKVTYVCVGGSGGEGGRGAGEDARGSGRRAVSFACQQLLPLMFCVLIGSASSCWLRGRTSCCLVLPWCCCRPSTVLMRFTTCQTWLQCCRQQHHPACTCCQASTQTGVCVCVHVREEDKQHDGPSTSATVPVVVCPSHRPSCALPTLCGPICPLPPPPFTHLHTHAVALRSPPPQPLAATPSLSSPSACLAPSMKRGCTKPHRRWRCCST